MIVEPAVPAPVLERIRAPFLTQEVTPADPPVLQPLNLLLDLAGEAMRARLFVVTGEAGAELALRPDFTVAIARDHLAAGRGEGRYFYEGRAFRTAPAGSDRPQEFLQIGLESLGGTASPEADAEMLALAWTASSEGGRADLELITGDLALFDAFAGALEVPPVLAARLRRSLSSETALSAALAAPAAETGGDAGRLAVLLARQPEAEATAVLEEVWALAGVQPVGGRTAAEIARRLAGKSDAPVLGTGERELIRRFLSVDDRPAAALDAMNAVCREAGVNLSGPLDACARRLDILDRLGVQAPARLTPAFGRAFDYYDGLLFEVRSAALGSDRPVAAGGRYDRLSAALGGPDLAAVGCMVRPARAWRGAAS